MYLQILFCCHSQKPYNSLGLEDIELKLDSCSTTLESTSSYDDSLSSDNLCGELHILYHPVFNVPTPYLRVWKSTGELLGVEDIQSMINNNIKSDSNSADARHYEFGQLMIENHPYLDCLYCTLHVCMLEERMTSIMSTAQDTSPTLYLLNWFSIIGPFIGFRISVEGYEKARKSLLGIRECNP